MNDDSGEIVVDFTATGNSYVKDARISWTHLLIQVQEEPTKRKNKTNIRCDDGNC